MFRIPLREDHMSKNVEKVAKQIKTNQNKPLFGNLFLVLNINLVEIDLGEFVSGLVEVRPNHLARSTPKKKGLVCERFLQGNESVGRQTK